VFCSCDQEIRWLKKELLKADRAVGTVRSIHEEKYFDGSQRFRVSSGTNDMDDAAADAIHFREFEKVKIPAPV